MKKALLPYASPCLRRLHELPEREGQERTDYEIFCIPSINAFVTLQTNMVLERGEFVVHNSHAVFSYVEGTPEEDLSQVRDIIEGAGLLRLVAQ